MLKRSFTVASLCIVAQTTGCGHAPILPDSMIASDENDPAREVLEPRANEVVIVINDNAPTALHAGMFAGGYLLDPLGAYVPARSLSENWRGPSLVDYVRFEMEDGPRVILYRFTLSRGQFAAIEHSAKDSGFTMPFFCAAKVHNVIAGLSPFHGIRKRFWISPVALARELDPLTSGPRAVGICTWPNGTPCTATEKLPPVQSAEIE